MADEYRGISPYYSTQLYTGFGAFCLVSLLYACVPIVLEYVRSLASPQSIALSCKDQVFASTISASRAAAERPFASLLIFIVAFPSLKVFKSMFFLQYLQ